MKNKKHFVNSIQLQNFLSFGYPAELALGPLNVLIGKNSCGKSNLVEALSLLQALPKDILPPVRQGGGIREWLWKGTKQPPVAELRLSLNCPAAANPLRYRLSFTEVNQRLELVDEAIENLQEPPPSDDDIYFYYRYQKGKPVLNVQSLHTDNTQHARRDFRSLQRDDLDANQSVLSQRKDPDQYPELTCIGSSFSKIRLYRE